jgi:hypothetical protein
MAKKPTAKREIKEVTAVRLRPSVKAAPQKAALDDARTVTILRALSVSRSLNLVSCPVCVKFAVALIAAGATGLIALVGKFLQAAWAGRIRLFPSDASASNYQSKGDIDV